MYPYGGEIHQPAQYFDQHNGYQKYKSKAAAVAGVLQIFLGGSILAAAIAIYITIVKTAVDNNLDLRYEGFGYSQFWASVLAICAGGFGVHSARVKTYCSIVATMIFSILSSLAILLIIAQGAIFFVALDALRTPYLVTSNDYLFVICFGVMLAFGCVEFIVAIVAAAYCCHGCCGQSRPGVAQQEMILFNQYTHRNFGVQQTPYYPDTPNYSQNGAFKPAYPNMEYSGINPSSYPNMTSANPYSSPPYSGYRSKSELEKKKREKQKRKKEWEKEERRKDKIWREAKRKEKKRAEKPRRKQFGGRVVGGWVGGGVGGCGGGGGGCGGGGGGCGGGGC